MNLVEYSPQVLIVSLIGVLGLGFIILFWPKTYPKAREGSVWGALLLLLIGMTPSFQKLLETDFEESFWIRGWIWPKNEVGSIPFGLLEDALGLTMGFFGVLISAVLLIYGKNELSAEQRTRGRVYTAIVLSPIGVLLSWMAGTPWTALGGLALTIFGGFLFLSLEWDQKSERKSGKNIAAQFGWERSWGFLLCMMGASGLAVSNSGFTFQSSQLVLDESGWILLIAGLLMQLQPFPFLGLLVSCSKVPMLFSVTLTQVFPAWAAFALLTRLFHYFRESEVFSVLQGLGWCALGSAIFALISGVLQVEWSQRLRSWLSAGFAIAFAVLTFSNSQDSLVILIGLSLSVLTLMTVACLVQSMPQKSAPTFCKTLIFFGVASGTGVLGFVTETGFQNWVYSANDSPFILPVFLFVYFLFVFLGWSLAYQLSQSKYPKDSSFPSFSPLKLAAPIFILLLSLDLFWTGHAIRLSNEWGVETQVLSSSLAFLFKSKANSLSEYFPPISPFHFWCYLSVVLGGVLCSFWYSKKKYGFENLKVVSFIRDGYVIRDLKQMIEPFYRTIGKCDELILNEKLWRTWVPSAFVRLLQIFSNFTRSIEENFSQKVYDISRQSIEVPAKMLQLIQNGNLQWYLIFGLGMGFAILVHYLKN